MKHFKSFGLLAAIVAATMAFAGTASADQATSNGALYTGNIHATNGGNHLSMHGSNGVTIECKSTMTGPIQVHGAGKTVEGNLSTLDFTACTGGEILHTPNKGRLIAHATSNGNATITVSGMKIEFTTTIFGFPLTCGYETGNNLHIGELTGSTTTKTNATIDLKWTIPRTFGSGLCGASGVWTGSYFITTPANLNIDKT